MRTMTISVFQFSELSEEAKEKAREWMREGYEYPWFKESIDSVQAFCDAFGVRITDYELSDYRPSFIDTDATKENFRGVKLKSIDRDQMPTGYCLDCDLWMTFYDQFKRTGDALYAFKEAIDAAVDAIVADIRYCYTDEAIDELIEINEYEFLEDGSPA